MYLSHKKVAECSCRPDFIPYILSEDAVAGSRTSKKVCVKRKIMHNVERINLVWCKAFLYLNINYTKPQCDNVRYSKKPRRSVNSQVDY